MSSAFSWYRDILIPGHVLSPFVMVEFMTAFVVWEWMISLDFQRRSKLLVEELDNNLL